MISFVLIGAMTRPGSFWGSSCTSTCECDVTLIAGRVDSSKFEIRSVESISMSLLTAASSNRRIEFSMALSMSISRSGADSTRGIAERLMRSPLDMSRRLRSAPESEDTEAGSQKDAHHSIGSGY